MKNKKLLLLIFSCAVSFTSFAQHFTNPEAYVNFVTKLHREVAQDELAYTNALMHTQSAKGQELKRKSILEKIKSVSFRIGAMHPFKSDRSLQDSAVAYLKTSYAIIHKDYPRILKLEDSSKVSLDAYAKYLKAQQEDLDHIVATEARLNTAVRQFASKYGIQLSENADDLFEKFVSSANVNKYHDRFHLIILKCRQLEAPLIKAIAKKDTAEIKKYNSALQVHVRESLGIFDTIRPYDNETSLLNATKQSLQFYQAEVELKAASIYNFLVKDAAYSNSKKVYDAKSQKEGAEQALEELNKTTAEYNELVSAYVTSTNELNEERPKVEANWDKASKNFLDKYVP